MTHNLWETPAGVSARFVLVRHGEPEASARGRCYGRLDVGLSESGREQIGVVAVAWGRHRLALCTRALVAGRARARRSLPGHISFHR